VKPSEQKNSAPAISKGEANDRIDRVITDTKKKDHKASGQKGRCRYSQGE